MELQYFGANCLRLSTKKASITVDDNLADLGLRAATKDGDITLFTGAHGEPAADARLVIDLPGEYEVSDISITGIPARAHIDEAGSYNATIYKLVVDDMRIVFLGHIYPELNEEQLEAIGTNDILVLPVGGNGYTLDATGALKMIKDIEPKVVIPTHYADKAINYPVPQAELDDALKNMSMEAQQRVAKIKLKAADLTDITQLVVLER